MLQITSLIWFADTNFGRLSYILIAQLCPEFTAWLVDRWQDLDAKHLPAVAQSVAEFRVNTWLSCMKPAQVFIRTLKAINFPSSAC